MPFLVCACCEEFLFTRNPLISRRCDTTIYYSPEDWLPKDVPLLTDLRTMPPLEDDTVRQCKAWWYADQQIRTEDMTRFVNVPDCEEGYPLLKSELPPGNLMEQHADHPKVYWPTEEPRITLGYLNFMYSKLVRILKTTTDIVYRQKAVQWCVEMLCTPDSRVRCILAGILPLLAEMAQTEEDMYLKQELTMCFKYASASTEAWDALVDLKCIDKLVEYVASDNKLLRGNALNALNDCCLSDRGGLPQTKSQM